ncbi:MAG: DUF359 domain-containing protein [Candidatus Lokiarchaeota archaeon]|nr:DUF359 domain-containing protein [Candidatus Lokiarchaeota archaeon]
MNPNTSYKIPSSVRKQLASPIGILFPGSISQNIPKVKDWLRSNSIINPEIICVGDVVSNAFLSDSQLSNHLKMCIIDKKTNRGKFEIDIDISDYYPVSIVNPAGILKKSSIQAIQHCTSLKKRVILYVEGEEDLLVLPVIMFSQENVLVIYGQPPITDLDPPISAGLVVIQVKESVRKLVLNILSQCEKIK